MSPVFGFLALLGFRFIFEKVPKPTSFTSSPFATAFWIISRAASRTASDWTFVIFVCVESFSTSWALFIVFSIRQHKVGSRIVDRCAVQKPVESRFLQMTHFETHLFAVNQT